MKDNKLKKYLGAENKMISQICQDKQMSPALIARTYIFLNTFQS